MGWRASPASLAPTPTIRTRTRRGRLPQTRRSAQFGIFGPIWTWRSSICAAWPFGDADRYIGPWNHRTSNPVLVIGNLFDPATRYQGAVLASNLLPNSRLLTVHGWGHTSLFMSQCADAVQTRYLVDLALPPVGTVCEQDRVPFTGP